MKKGSLSFETYNKDFNIIYYNLPTYLHHVFISVKEIPWTKW